MFYNRDIDFRVFSTNRGDTLSIGRISFFLNGNCVLLRRDFLELKISVTSGNLCRSTWTQNDSRTRNGITSFIITDDSMQR